jgi:hypothetical protein
MLQLHTCNLLLLLLLHWSSNSTTKRDDTARPDAWLLHYK